jgi:hypothetical protein
VTDTSESRAPFDNTCTKCNNGAAIVVSQLHCFPGLLYNRAAGKKVVSSALMCDALRTRLLVASRRRKGIAMKGATSHERNGRREHKELT